MAALLAKALAIAVLVPGPCPPPIPPGWPCAVPPVTIYLAPPVEPGDIDHELGHIIDYNLLTDQDRGMFLALLHRRGPWRQPANSPHEQFAEAVRMCARSVRWPDSTAGFGYFPTRITHRKVCRWLASIGGR